MMGGGKGARPVAHDAPRILSLRVSTAAYGQPWILLFGTQRLAFKLLDYDDFKAIAHTDVIATGGKGGGGGGNTTQTSYTYQAAVLGALCEGKIAGILNVWDFKGVATSTSSTETYTLGGTTQSVVNAATWFFDVGVVKQISETIWVDDEWRRGDIGDDGTGGGHYETITHYEAFVRVASSPAAGQYSVAAGVYTFNAADIGATVLISYKAAGTNTPLGQFGFSLFDGSDPQTAWAYMTSAHPSKALAYAGKAYVANQSLDLGSNGDLPQFSFEVAGLDVAGGLTLDSNAADYLPHILSAAQYGANFPSTMVGDVSALRTWITASGLFISPFLDAQRAVNDWLEEILECINVGAVWSSGLLKFIPFGEKTITDNGVTYTPDTAPKYDLDVDDFIAENEEPAIRFKDADVKDAYNKIFVEFLDRTNNYNTAVLDDEDKAHIELFGLRAADVKSYHSITTKEVCQKVMRNRINYGIYVEPVVYQFTLSMKHVLLEGMDVVTLTHAALGFEKLPVRIKSIEEDDNDRLHVEAWPFPFGTATPTLYPKQDPSSFAPNYKVAPGSVNAPIIFESPDSLSTSFGKYEVRIGVSGVDVADWGGCSVWLSQDGTNYKKVGEIGNPARMGQLSASLASHADPDTTNTLSVNLSASGAALLSGTDDDRDSLRTLCYIEESAGSGEFISYKTATLTGANAYDLTSLRRGALATIISSHASGKKFLRIDERLFVVSFDSEDVGKTIYAKFTSFNKFRQSEQALSDVTAYSFALSGKYNNFSQIVGNDATVDNVGTGGPPFTAVTVRTYGKVAGVPTVGQDISLKKSDGTSRTTAASSFAGKALSTFYYSMMNSADNSKYLLTTYGDMMAAVGNGHICFGSTITVDAGGSGGTGGGGGGTGGGGGGTGCPCVEMFVRDNLKFAYVRKGSILDCLNGTEVTYKRSIKNCRIEHEAPAVHIITANGAEFGCSKMTPFTLITGETEWADKMLGELVATDDGEGTPVVWSPVVQVIDIGKHSVMHVDLGGEVFAAGAVVGGKRIYSHNISKQL